MFVCNGETPCPTLLAEEGDIVELNVHNDLFAPVSVHWSGMDHRRFGFWNDGTGGLNQVYILIFPIRIPKPPELPGINSLLTEHTASLGSFNGETSHPVMIQLDTGD